MADDYDPNKGCICPGGCLIRERVDPNKEAGLTHVKCTNVKCGYTPGFMHDDCFYHWEDNLVKIIVKNCYRGKDWSKKEVEKSLWTSDRANSGFKFVWRLCRCPCGGVIKKDSDVTSVVCEVQPRLASANGVCKSHKAKLPNIPLLNSPKKVACPSKITTTPCDIADRFGETKSNQSSTVKVPVGLHVDPPLPMTSTDIGDKGKRKNVIRITDGGTVNIAYSGVGYNAAKAKPAGYTGWKVVGKDGRAKSTMPGEMAVHDSWSILEPSTPRRIRLSSAVELHATSPPHEDESRSTPSPEPNALLNCRIPPTDQISSSSTLDPPASGEPEDGWQVVTTKRKIRQPAIDVDNKFHCKPIPLNSVKVPELSFEFSSAFHHLFPGPSRWYNEETMPPRFLYRSIQRNSTDVYPGTYSRRYSVPEVIWEDHESPFDLPSSCQPPTSFDDTNMNDLVRDLENVDMSSSSDEGIDSFYAPGEGPFDTSGHRSGAGSVPPHEMQSYDISGHLQSSESADIYRYRRSFVQLIDLIALYDTSFSL